jgi:hypothetical protein
MVILGILLFWGPKNSNIPRMTMAPEGFGAFWSASATARGGGRG